MNDKITQSITRTYRCAIWSRFIKALKEFSLLKENDKVILFLSNKKEALLLAATFKVLKFHSDFHFDIDYIVVKNRFSCLEYKELINNLSLLNINYLLINDEKSVNLDEYNKIIDFNNYDDVIVSTLKSILYEGKFKTIIPLSNNGKYEIINPLYYVREKDINNFISFNKIKIKEEEKSEEYIFIKKLIDELLKNNEFTEKNIFKCTQNVNLDKVLGYYDNNNTYLFNDYYEKNNL